MFLKDFGVRNMSTFLTLVDSCGPSSSSKCNLEEIRMERSFPVGFITSSKRTLWHHSYHRILNRVGDHIIKFDNKTDCSTYVHACVCLKLVSKCALDPVVFAFGNYCHLYHSHRKLVIMTLTLRIKHICIEGLYKYTEYQ